MGICKAMDLAKADARLHSCPPLRHQRDSDACHHGQSFFKSRPVRARVSKLNVKPDFPLYPKAKNDLVLPRAIF